MSAVEAPVAGGVFGGRMAPFEVALDVEATDTMALRRMYPVPAELLDKAALFTAAVDKFMNEDPHQLISAAGQGRRLDRYAEDGDMVYSIIHPLHLENSVLQRELSSQHIRQATSIINGGDGKTYGDWHWFSGDQEHTKTKPHDGIQHALRRSIEWQEQIIPVTRYLTDGRWLLRVIQ